MVFFQAELLTLRLIVYLAAPLVCTTVSCNNSHGISGFLKSKKTVAPGAKFLGSAYMRSSSSFRQIHIHKPFHKVVCHESALKA